MHPVSLPYALPERWQLSRGTPARWWQSAIGSLLALGLAVLSVLALSAGETGRALWYTALFSAIGLAMAIGYDRNGGQDGVPELLNAIVLSRARTAPPDSWIHFFREAGPGRWLTGWFAGVGLVASALLVWAGARAIAAGGAAVWLLLPTVPLLLGALLVTLVGGIAIVLRWRHASFGRRPIGLSIGASGVVRYYLDGVDDWPWERIASVQASVSAVDEQSGDFEPRVTIIAADPDESETYELGGYRSHAYLIYTALRFWAEHPEHRHELSTTFAQQRIIGWRDAMHAQPVSESDVVHPG